MPGWNALMDRKLALGEFKVLCHRLDGLLKHTADDADQLRSSLTDILMAQDFQDLTGQMIRKVIGLVHEIETKLVEMSLLFGEPTHKQVEKQAVSQLRRKGQSSIKNKGRMSLPIKMMSTICCQVSDSEGVNNGLRS